MRRKKERSKQGQTNKAKQHSTPKAVTFPRKNELPQVGLEPTTLYTLDVYVCVHLCVRMHEHSLYFDCISCYYMYMYMCAHVHVQNVCVIP